MSDPQVPAAAAAPLPTDPAEIQQAIEVRQARLASTVDELTTRLSPKDIVARGRATLQERARAAVLTPDGAPRMERIAAVGVAVLAVVAAVVVRRVRR